MEGKIKLLVRSVSEGPDGRHEFSQTGNGLIQKETDGWRLRYTARDESGERGGWDLRLRESFVTVQSMTGSYVLELDPGRRTFLRLDAGGNTAEMEIETHRISWSLDDERRGRIEMDYTMLIAGEIISGMSLQMQLKKK